MSLGGSACYCAQELIGAGLDAFLPVRRVRSWHGMLLLTRCLVVCWLCCAAALGYRALRQPELRRLALRLRTDVCSDVSEAVCE